MDVEVLFKAGAAATAAVVATIVVGLGRRRTPHLALAGFLVLIASNQAVEAVLAWVGHEQASSWAGLAAIFSAWDPFLLYAFAETFPRAGHRPRRSRIRAAALGAIALTLGLVSLGGRPPSILGLRAPGGLFPLVMALAIDAYTVTLYVAGFRQAVRWFHDEDAHRALGWLVIGLAVLALVAAARATGAVVLVLFSAVGVPAAGAGFLLAGLLAGPAAMGTCLVGLPRPSGTPRRAPAAYLAVGVLLAAASWVLLVVRDVAAVGLGATGATLDAYGVAGQVAGSVRLSLASVALGISLVRYDLLGVPLAARNRAATYAASALVAIAVGSLMAAAGGLAAATGLSPWPVAAVAGAILVLATPLVQRAIVRVASLFHGAGLGQVEASALATYQEAVELALRDGRRTADDPDLDRLRGELGLTRREASTIELLVGHGSDRAPLTPGDLLAGRYRVDRLLAVGGGGRVFRGRHLEGGGEVVMKEVLNDGTGNRAADIARVAMGIHHPNVVSVVDVVETGIADVVVMEYVGGGTLEADVQGHGRLPAGRALPLLVGIAEGLEALHDAGIVHGDVKPANVLLDDRGTPRIADLGTASRTDRDTVRVGSGTWTEGTPGFVAPEVVQGHGAMPQADVYAMGRLIASVVERPLPAHLERVVERACRTSPEARYRNGGALRRALTEALGAEEQEASTDPDELP